MGNSYRRTRLLLDQALEALVHAGGEWEDDPPSPSRPEHNPVERQSPASAQATNGGQDDSLEAYTCPSRRCQARRDKNKAGEVELFAAEWREMKVRGARVWVVDVILRCPDCGMKQTRTLIPPVLQAIQDLADSHTSPATDRTR